MWTTKLMLSHCQSAGLARVQSRFNCYRIGYYCLVMALPFLCLLTTGCSCGIAIVDTENYSVIVRQVGGSFLEKPLVVSQDGIMTLQRAETNCYILRHVSFDGKGKTHLLLPRFADAYFDKVAFRNDGQRVAYMKLQGSEGVYSLELSPMSTVMNNLLPADFYITEKGFYGCLVLWLDSESLLIQPRVSVGMEHIDLIRLDNKKVTRLCEVSASYGPTLVSPSGRLLVVSDSIDDTLRYRILVYDLNTKKKVFEVLPPGQEMAARGVVWSSDDELVFTSDNVIYTQKIGAAAPTELFRLKERYGAWLYAVDNNRNLHYARYDRESDCPRAIGGWRIFNLDTKKERVISRLKISDKALMTLERDKIVAEVEY